jgi:hypothetical protein
MALRSTPESSALVRLLSGCMLCAHALCIATPLCSSGLRKPRIARADYSAALDYALQLIEIDRGREEATRLTMRRLPHSTDAAQRWRHMRLSGAGSDSISTFSRHRQPPRCATRSLPVAASIAFRHECYSISWCRKLHLWETVHRDACENRRSLSLQRTWME